MKNTALLILLSTAFSVYALEPNAPAVRVQNGAVVAEYATGLPARVIYADDRPYYNATHRHESDGIMPAQFATVPEGTVLVSASWEIVDGVAVQTLVTETQAEAAARQQEAQAAQLQAIVDAAGDQIRQLEAIIDKYDVPRPASPMVCLAVIGAAKDAAKASNDAMGVAEAGADGVILLTLYSGLADAGVDATTVNAVWQYMVATGQGGAE